MNVGSLFGGAVFAESFSQNASAWQSRAPANASQSTQAAQQTGASGPVQGLARAEHAHGQRSGGSDDEGGFGAFVTALAQALQQSGLVLPSTSSAPGATSSAAAGTVAAPAANGKIAITAIGSGARSTTSASAAGVTSNGTSPASSGTAATDVSAPGSSSVGGAGGATSTTATSSSDPAQALFKFAQDLFAVLNGRGGANSTGGSQGGDSDGDGDRDGGGSREGREGGVRGYHSLATALQGLLGALQSSNAPPSAGSGAASTPSSGSITATFEEARLQGSNGNFSLNITEISITETFGAKSAGSSVSPAAGAAGSPATGAGTPTTTDSSTTGNAGGAASALPADPWASAIDQLKNDFAALITSLQAAPGTAGAAPGATSSATGSSQPSVGTMPVASSTPPAGGAGAAASISVPTTSGGSAAAGGANAASTAAGTASAAPDIGSLFQNFVQNMLSDAQASDQFSFHAVGAFLSVTA